MDKPRAAIKFVTLFFVAVHPKPPGREPLGHHIGSPVSMMSAAACVASGTGVPVASNTTTGVSVGTAPTKVEVSVGATDVAAAEVAADAAEVLAGATEVSAEGTDVSAGATEVLTEGAEVSAADGACEAEADVSAATGGCVAGAEVSAAGGCVAAAGADVSVAAGGCVAAEAGAEVSAAADAAGGGGVAPSARATKGCTALTTMTSNIRLVNNRK